MGVYIKGMKMPTSCAGCFNRGCGLWREVELPAHERHKYCPLVPVPKHGRCIDADELMKHKGECYDADGHLLYAVGTGNILRAPTIIPAEEGE